MDDSRPTRYGIQEVPRRGERVTRRALLKTAAATAGAAAIGGAAFGVDRMVAGGTARRPLPAFPVTQHGATWRFTSRPDLRPPAVHTSGVVESPGYLLLGPGSTAETSQEGPLVVGDDGEIVWFRPLAHGLWASNVAASTYRGRPVLAWWQGKVIAPGFGQGEAMIVDSAYKTVRRVHAGHGRQMDLHEFQLTPQGTALFTCYPQTVATDLSAIGGPVDGQVMESIFQEVDLSTGRVLLEWRSLDHIPVTDSYKPVGEPYDYLHVNSIDVAPDGNLLISARHTWALYKVDRHTGEIMWRLGGKHSDFSLDRDAQFSWQHDARMPSNSTISVFDDGSDGPQTTEKQSRGLVLAVDETARTVKVARSYRHPRSLLASAMGSVQLLPDGNAFVGWGTAPFASEFRADGTLAADARLPSPLYSYRARRSPWRGMPAAAPDIAVRRTSHDAHPTVYASWNGATEVARWTVHTGSSRRHLALVGSAARRGFETAIRVDGARYVAVAAVDRTGGELARSTTIRL